MVSEVARQTKTGTLFLVPTPIGNLEDMTFRAIKTLKSVQVILAEDTRHTRKLLNHFQIENKLESFHEHSDSYKIERIVSWLQEGQDIALVSDAGMPIINDPGHPLVAACVNNNVNVVALPGANAALTALIASGLSAESFTYYGFFPRNNKRREDRVRQIAERDETAIFYESPHRVQDLLQALSHQLTQDTQVVLARELTKRYEEYIRGSLLEVRQIVMERELKGECVVLVQGGRPIERKSESGNSLLLKEEVEKIMVRDTVSSKVAIKEVAKRYRLKKQEVYQAYHEIDS